MASAEDIVLDQPVVEREPRVGLLAKHQELHGLAQLPDLFLELLATVAQLGQVVGPC